eukprot:PhF_6_TR19726/c0_g1_i1/m.28792
MSLLGSRSSKSNSRSLPLSSLVSNDVSHYLHDITTTSDHAEIMRIDSALRDKIYMKSFQLRNLFRSLDVAHNGFVSIQKVTEAFRKELSLKTAEEFSALKRVLDVADKNKNGFLSYDEFTAAMRTMAAQEQPSNTSVELDRFQHSGITRSMHKILDRGDNDVGLINRRPANELGVARTNPPFNMIGDSERIAAMHSAVLVAREEQLKKVLLHHDANRDGLLSHQEFRAALRELEPQISIFHEGDMIRQLDVERRGWVVIDDFLRRFGFTFLQPPSLRGSLGAGNILAWSSDPAPGNVTMNSTVLRSARKSTKTVNLSESLLKPTVCSSVRASLSPRRGEK